MSKKISLFCLALVFSFASLIYANSDISTKESIKSTEIIFLLDRSGSMGGLETDTIGGFNGFVKKQSEMGPTKITTILFDDRYEVLHNGVNAKNVVLTKEEYYTRGSTSLLDAIGKTINDVNARLEKTAKDEQPQQIIFVITTDGYENSSKEFTYAKISEMIKLQQEKHHWEFIFMGANIDVATESAKLNIPSANAFSYEASEEGTSRMFKEANSIVNDTRNKNEKNN